MHEVKGYVSLVDALYKLEGGKDIPSVTLAKFNNNPLEHADFVDPFKNHIHYKAQISGLGSKEIMYATP